MPSDSDSEKFYDAEDSVPAQNSRKVVKPEKHSAESFTDVSNLCQDEEHRKKKYRSFGDDLNETEEVRETLVGGRQRFEEIRQKLQIDDEDYQSSNVTPPNSQNSSVDGISLGSNRTSYPFRIIEQDTISLQSLNSLGRVGRILVGSTDSGTFLEHEEQKATSISTLSSSSLDSDNFKQLQQYPSTRTLLADDEYSKSSEKRSIPLQEPDVIASTKSNTIHQGCSEASHQHISTRSDAPVAPPRRKKKNQNKSSGLILKESESRGFEPLELASPASTIESLTREFEHSLDQFPATKSLERNKYFHKASPSLDLHPSHSLDITQVLKGQFVVKSHDKSVKACSRTKNDRYGVNEDLDLSTEKMTITNNTPRGSSSRSSLGHYSLGPHRGTHQNDSRNSARERRRSAGDEKCFIHVRTHTNSGKQLSDLEILEQVTVLNLDTGERVPLSVAEDKLPQCINPLSLHIMRITSEYVSNSSMEKEKESDEDSVDKMSEGPSMGESDLEMGRLRQKTAKFKHFLGSTVKKTMHRAKTIAQEVTHARHKEDTIDIVDNVHPGEQNCKLKASSSHKGPYEFEKIEHVQELTDDQHEGPIWCMKFSGCGRLLATAGQDKILRIWIVKDAYQFFQEMRTKYNAEKVSPTPSTESLISHHSADVSNNSAQEGSVSDTSKLAFMPKTFCTYTGHTSDLLDVSWSKNYFILSSSMDKTVRLWHISRKECLCCFQHIDFVTAIVFHPRDDRYFLSGSLDGKLRLWNIPDKKVAVWTEVEGNPKLITAANFCQNGKFAVVGTYDGRCIFYTTDQLKYHTQIHVRSSRGRNSVGRKISGIEPMPGEDKILVTSNDSRIRLYDLRDLNVSCKYKGYVNMSSQIKASFSHDGKYIASGSENRDIYIWKTSHDYSKFSSVRRDRNDFWEAIKAHNATVTCAIFAPNPEAIIRVLEDNGESDEKIEDPVVQQHTKGGGGYVLISADFNGCIKVFINKTKPKHSSLPVSAMA